MNEYEAFLEKNKDKNFSPVQCLFAQTILSNKILTIHAKERDTDFKVVLDAIKK